MSFVWTPEWGSELPYDFTDDNIFRGSWSCAVSGNRWVAVVPRIGHDVQRCTAFRVNQLSGVCRKASNRTQYVAAVYVQRYTCGSWEVAQFLTIPCTG